MSDEAAARDAELLKSGCQELGVELTASQQGALLDYLDLLYVWNRSAGLTTIPRGDAVRLHLLDSLAALPVLGASPCLDLGSGGGLPGLVLAVARPEVSFALVESNRRKCSFLMEAVRKLALANVRVVEADYERFSPDRPFPTVLSRAFRPPAEFLTIARRFLEPMGRVLLLLADPSDSDLAGLAGGSDSVLESCLRLELPVGREPRAIATFRFA